MLELWPKDSAWHPEALILIGRSQQRLGQCDRAIRSYGEIAERYPEYLPDFNRTMHKRSGHRFNLLIMRKDLFRRYCVWLFELLFELEGRLDTSAYTGLNARVYGLVSERLLDVWVEHNKIHYVELPVVHLESQHWPKKVFHFLERKFSTSTAH